MYLSEWLIQQKLSDGDVIRHIKTNWIFRKDSWFAPGFIETPDGQHNISPQKCCVMQIKETEWFVVKKL